MILEFIKSNILSKKLRSFLTIFSIAISVILIIVIMNLFSQAEDGIIANAQNYDVLIGADGSRTQLAMNILMFYDEPLGNIDYHYYEHLQSDDRVNLVVPIGMGDNYKGFKIIGTKSEYIDNLNTSIKQGRNFFESGEVVLGAFVARQTSLEIGDTFVGSHGLGTETSELQDEAHDSFQYTVVGILDVTNTANDQALFTDIESVWDVHSLHHSEDEEEHHEGEEHGDSNEEGEEHHDEADHEEEQHDETDHKEADHEEADHEDSNEESDEHNDDHEEHDHDEPSVTAVLLKSKSFTDAYLITEEYDSIDGIQALNPSSTLRRLLESLDTGEKVAALMAMVSVILAVITLFVVMLSVSNERLRDMAILRSLGAKRKTIFRIMLLETLILSLVGCIIGFVLAHIALAAVSNVVFGAFGIFISPFSIKFTEILILIAILILSAFAGLMPAVRIYRSDASRHLR